MAPCWLVVGCKTRCVKSINIVSMVGHTMAMLVSNAVVIWGESWKGKTTVVSQGRGRGGKGGKSAQCFYHVVL